MVVYQVDSAIQTRRDMAGLISRPLLIQLELKIHIILDSHKFTAAWMILPIIYFFNMFSDTMINRNFPLPQSACVHMISQKMEHHSPINYSRDR